MSIPGEGQLLHGEGEEKSTLQSLKKIPCQGCINEELITCVLILFFNKSNLARRNPRRPTKTSLSLSEFPAGPALFPPLVTLLFLMISISSSPFLLHHSTAPPCHTQVCLIDQLQCPNLKVSKNFNCRVISSMFANLLALASALFARCYYLKSRLLGNTFAAAASRYKPTNHFTDIDRYNTKVFKGVL